MNRNFFISTIILLLFVLNGYSQNKYIRTKSSNLMHGLVGNLMDTADNAIFFSYAVGTKKQYTEKIVSLDNEFKPGKTIPYEKKYESKKSWSPASKLDDGKVFRFTDEGYSLPEKSFNVNASNINEDNFSIPEPTLVSKNNKYTAIVQKGYANEVAIWMFDEDQKEIYRKVIVRDFLKPKMVTIRERMVVSDRGDLYILYYIMGRGDLCLGHVDTKGKASFIQIMLAEKMFYNAGIFLDNESNPVVSYTHNSKPSLNLYEAYGMIRFDSNLKITGRFERPISEETCNAVYQKGPHHKGILSLIPEAPVFRSDGSIVYLAEQNWVDAGSQGGSIGTNYSGAYVIFFLSKDMKEKSSYVVNKRRPELMLSNSPACYKFQKGDDIYLFYKKEYETRERTDGALLMRVITPDNKVTEEMIAKNEEGKQIISPVAYVLADDELLFVAADAKQELDFSLLSVKLIRE